MYALFYVMFVIWGKGLCLCPQLPAQATPKRNPRLEKWGPKASNNSANTRQSVWFIMMQVAHGSPESLALKEEHPTPCWDVLDMAFLHGCGFGTV